MEGDSSTDDERAEWDEAWRNRPLRQLICPVQIDVAPTLNHTFGNVIHVDIAADPPQFVDSIWRKDDLCPVCGTAPSVDSRIAVTVYSLFRERLFIWPGRLGLSIVLCNLQRGRHPPPIPW